MELFEQIRREYEHGVGTIKGIAQKLGVHRRMVCEAVANAVPIPRKQAKREKVIVLKQNAKGSRLSPKASSAVA